MIRFFIASMSSGHGKTVLTCALLEALRRRGREIRAFKCGPDYIDPAFHRMIDGVTSRNLDLFLSDLNPGKLKKIYSDAIRGYDVAIFEGAMGFYDGLGGVTARGSAWDTARILNSPVILTVSPRGNALTLTAQIRGLRDFRENNYLIGVILNPCSPDFYQVLSPVLERETGLPVLGYLPRMKEAEFTSRHLGLRPPDENREEISNRFGVLADKLEEGVNLDKLISLCEDDKLNLDLDLSFGDAARDNNKNIRKIAVARDSAFCFLYPENIEILKAYGAEILFFSPMKDQKLPDEISGLYLPGGYPECHARELSENLSMRDSIVKAIQNGLPVMAEGGGFLYLGEEIQNQDGENYPMTGILPGKAFPTGHLVRFGYAYMTARFDSLLFRAGETIPVHEFHYWDRAENGCDFDFKKPVSNRVWSGGFARKNLYAGFGQLYFPGHPELAERFVDAAKKYKI